MDLEDFSKFKKIDLSDKAIFDAYFQRYTPQISEYTFTNLFMWRDYYQFRWIEWDNCLLLLSLRIKDTISLFPPVGEKPQVAIEYILKLAQKQFKYILCERIPEKMLDLFSKIALSHEIIEDRDNWDYEYRVSELRELAGGDLFNERKKLNKFKRSYEWTFEPLNEKNALECIKLQLCWCGLRECEDDPSLSVENHAIQEMLKLFNVLNFTGGIININGKIEAFTLGEKLNSTTMVVHVEKANPEIIGLYQAINQQFAEKIAKEVEYINREQDLGNPALRRAKENYHPTQMVKKYKIQFK